jgi:hypothetical protein
LVSTAVVVSDQKQALKGNSRQVNLPANLQQEKQEFSALYCWGIFTVSFFL